MALACAAPACAAPPADCLGPAGMAGAAVQNAVSLHAMTFSPFGHIEIGWETYLPAVQHEIGSACPAGTPGFAAALSRWQARARLSPTGVMDADAFQAVKAAIQSRRICPAPPTPDMLVAGAAAEGYGGKSVVLRPGALDAYRRMVREARATSPAIRADARNLTIFSSFRSPDYDAARCLRDNNCDGVRRATCSPHRTGDALDLYLGAAPGYGPDSTADPGRLYLSQTPTYRWLVANAARFGFVNYLYEPWHWEWAEER